MIMNRIMTIATMVLLLLISCGEKERVVEIPVPANCPPSAPAGVYSVNLDGTVLICWRANPESDIEGYDVYRGTSYYGEYAYLGSVEHTNADEYCFEDLDTGNGIQFYYAVAAYDEGGLESELSFEEVTGTPRPEGEVTLQDYGALPADAGYDLSSLSSVTQAYNAATTDVFFSGSGGAKLIVAHRAGVELQDYGYVGDFDAINYAPADGWSPSRSVEAIPDHIYIVRLIETDGTHYAKLYVRSVTAAYVTFWWAYQTDPGNRDLAPAAPGSGSGSKTSSLPRDAMPGEKMYAMDLAARSAIPPIVERVAWTRDDESAQRTTE
jgi:hypothetical protein